MLLLGLHRRKDSPAQIKAKAPRATHWIVVTDGDDEGGCTAYAISRHVLLTADHCTMPDSDLYIDQDRHHLKVPSEVTEAFFDHHDHVLLVLPKSNFVDTIPYDPSTPFQGEEFYFWGSPHGTRDQYREGYVSGQTDAITEDGALNIAAPVYLLVSAIVKGDSGAAIFDKTTGRIVTLVTYGGLLDGGFGGGYSLAFTSKQVKDAEK